MSNLRKLIALASYENSDHITSSRMSIHLNRLFIGHRAMKTMNISAMISNMRVPFRVVSSHYRTRFSCEKLKNPCFLGVLKFWV